MTEDTRTAEQSEARRSAIVAEMRAQELVAVMRRAVSGGPHWREDAKTLLEAIKAGIPPYRPEPPHQQEAA